MSFPITRFAPTAGPQGPSVYPRGYIDGLILSNAADADHDITVAVGACRASTNVENMDLAAAITKQIDASWAAGSAAGGLFSGSVANATWYHVFLIRKDVDGSIDAGFDTSVTAANKPAGYSTYRRIGSVLTNGSANIIGFWQKGDEFWWKANGANGFDINTTTLGAASVTYTLGYAPTGVPVRVILNCAAYCAAAAPLVLVRCPDSTDEAVAGDISNTQFNAAAGAYRSGSILVWTNTSAQIAARAYNANTQLLARVFGWKDLRGKDA